jgi:hypothetical protein
MGLTTDRSISSSLVADKIVDDAMNYWPPIDGVQELFEDRQLGSSEIVARRLSRSMIVKTLNYGMGGLTHKALMTNIELYGTQVIPPVRELLPQATIPATSE